MASETSTYPGTLDSFTDKEAKQDLADKSDINKLQNCLTAVQTELGTDPAGSSADVKTRLAMIIDANGSIAKGTSFPGSPVAGQLFFRSDLNTLYIRNAANDTWLALGGSLSNLIYCWNGIDTYTENQAGMYFGTSLVATAPNGYMYRMMYGDTYVTVLTSKFKKISGISTITILGKIWPSNAGQTVTLNVDIGGQANTVTRTGATTPGWATGADIDVSSLTNGTVYDITVQLKNSASNYFSYCSGIVLVGS